MRYLFLTYCTQADGTTAEQLQVSNKIKLFDRQTVNIILDFKELKIEKFYVPGVDDPKDWDGIVAYYYEHYPHIIERLFQENGYALQTMTPEEAVEAGVEPGVQTVDSGESETQSEPKRLDN